MEKPTSVVSGPEVYWSVIEPSSASDSCSDSSRGHTGDCTALLWSRGDTAGLLMLSAWSERIVRPAPVQRTVHLPKFYAADAFTFAEQCA